MTKTKRIDEEKMLNEMFILLEYSDSFYDFVGALSKECFQQLKLQVELRDIKDSDGAGIM